MPATVPARVELPELAPTGGEEDNVDPDEGSIDWTAESTPAAETPEVVEEETPPVTPAPKAPVVPPKPAAAPAAPAAPAPAPTPSPAAPAAETPPAPAAETPEAKAAREAAETKERERVETEQFAKLTEYYKLPDELAAKLATEPEVVLPVLAAKVHQALLRSSFNMLQAELPRMVKQLQEFGAAEEKSKNAFYERWPELKDYEKQVLQVGKMYRQMNPGAKPDEAIEKIGRVVKAALGLAEVAAPPGAPAKPAAPAARPAAFRPAATQASAAAATPPADNIFAQMAEEFLHEDAG